MPRTRSAPPRGRPWPRSIRPGCWPPPHDRLGPRAPRSPRPRAGGPARALARPDRARPRPAHLRAAAPRRGGHGVADLLDGRPRHRLPRPRRVGRRRGGHRGLRPRGASAARLAAARAPRDGRAVVHLRRGGHPPRAPRRRPPRGHDPCVLTAAVAGGRLRDRSRGRAAPPHDLLRRGAAPAVRRLTTRRTEERSSVSAMRRVLVLTLFVLLVAGAPEALADGLSFTAPQQLPHGDPTKPDYLSGGEPSLAFDPNGDGHVYVTAPQFIPTGANNACNQLGAPLGIPSLCSPTNSPTGIGYWASDDGGRTWPRSGNTGTANGGGDSDVAVLPAHTVLAADLEAADAAVCLSHDFAKTFDNCNSGITSDHTGPENDREWLTVAGKTVYLSYHDFTAGIPIIERSDDGGKSWQPCGNIIDPSVATTYTPQGGTLVAKPIVDKDGTVYVEFITPDSTAPPVGATLGNVYIAVAKGGCSNGTQFKNYKVFADPTADLGKIFLADAIDGGGQLYVLAGGKTNSSQKNTDLWLFTSADGGAHWSKPIPANPPELTANVFPWIAGGPYKGQVAIGWFGTDTNPDPNNLHSQWRY